MVLEPNHISLVKIVKCTFKAGAVCMLPAGSAPPAGAQAGGPAPSIQTDTMGRACRKDGYTAGAGGPGGVKKGVHEGACVVEVMCHIMETDTAE